MPKKTNNEGEGEKNPIEELREIENTLAQKQLISKDLLLLLRYFELRDEILLRKMAYYTRLMSVEQITTAFDLGAKIAERLMQQQNQGNIKQIWNDFKGILKEITSSFSMMQQPQISQASSSGSSMFSSSEEKPKLKVSFEE
jgi:hypothetical protein